MKKLILDNSIKNYEDRLKYIENKIEEIGEENLSPSQLDRISTYLIEGTNLKTRGDIITSNRRITVNKRETSKEGLTEKLEGGDNAFHQLIKQDKNTILTPKVEITEKDIKEVPGLAQLVNEIKTIEKRIKEGEGVLDSKTLGKLKKMAIEMRRDQYVLKNSFRQPIFGRKGGRNIDKDKFYDITLQSPEQVLTLILNYTALKLEFREENNSDIKWILEDLDNLIKEALGDKPVLLYILQQKIIGTNNEAIREGLLKNYNVEHTEEYISSLYRNKIPNCIANLARVKWIDFMFLENFKGEYKKCSRCKEIKLANNNNYSINRTSSSQFYSICKKCRNKKGA